MMLRAVATKNSEGVEKSGDLFRSAVNVAGMHSLFSWLTCRFRGRLELDLEIMALPHQLAVMRRQRPVRTQLFSSRLTPMRQPAPTESSSLNSCIRPSSSSPVL